MPRRDYILRLIERMGRVLAAIRVRILGGEAADVRGELREVITWSGIDLEMAETVDTPTLLSLLSLGGSLDVAKCVLVADVLGVESLRRQALGQAAIADGLRKKAIVLYGAARPLVAGDDAEALNERIAALDDESRGA